MKGGRYGWWTLGIVVVLSAMVPTAYVLQPHVQRWRMLAALDSPDMQERERALNYVIQQAPQDERVRRGAIAAMGKVDGQAFEQLLAAFDTAGLWQRDVVGDGPWLRRIERLAATDSVAARFVAAQLAADLGDLADDPRVVSLIEQLTGDEQADVRQHALIAAGALAGAADDDERYTPLIASLTRDRQSEIVRRAWILLGLLEPASGVRGDWRSARPDVAEAMLWAAARTNPRAPLPALEALGDEKLRPAAVYALAFSDAPEARAALRRVAEGGEGIAARRARAALDGSPRPEPAIDELRALLAVSNPAVRDAACVMAVEQLGGAALDALIEELIRDYDDDAKMSGAVLAGMTGRRLGLLAEREAVEDVYAVRTVQRLGLWMAGRLQTELSPGGLLVREDLPRSTILLAMLHRGEYEALDHLLNRHGEADAEALADLLVRRRWAWVLARYLPPDAPAIWTGGDPGLTAFQVEVLRLWWLIHRYDLLNREPDDD